MKFCMAVDHKQNYDLCVKDFCNMLTVMVMVQKFDITIISDRFSIARICAVGNYICRNGSLNCVIVLPSISIQNEA